MPLKTSILIVCDVGNRDWARSLQKSLQERGFRSVRLGVDPGNSEAVAVIWLLNRKQFDPAFNAGSDRAEDEVLAWLQGPPLHRTDPVLDAVGYRKGSAKVDRESWNTFVESVVRALIKRAGVSPFLARVHRGTSAGRIAQLAPSRSEQVAVENTELPPQMDDDAAREQLSAPELDPTRALTDPSRNMSDRSAVTPDIAQPMETGVFICYRRQHAEGYAGRIFDRLTSELPSTRLFMDVDNIQPGEDFVEIIDRAISECRVMLVLITRDWADAADRTGTRLIDRPDDFVRLEIGKAIERNVVLIPVLVGGAAAPHAEKLPDSVAPLARRNAIELRHTSWREDVNKLMRVLHRLLASGTDSQ